MIQETPTLSPEEREQVTQTVDMFEVIVQANPRDTQSLEILRDAYRKLGRESDSRRVQRLLATALAEDGNYASAIIEYESLLAGEPDNPELIAALGDVEERMHRAGATAAPAVEMDFGTAVSESGSLIATSHTAAPVGSRGVTAKANATIEDLLASDGDEPFARFLIQTRLVPEDVVVAALDRVQKRRSKLQPGTLGASLIDEIITRGGAELEPLLSGVLDRTKFAYIPLEHYDIDRQIVKMLPEQLALGRLIVPFDVMSRTLMVATVNPFDAGAKAAAQQSVDFHIQWHLASPAAVMKVLRDAYRLGSPGSPPSFQPQTPPPGPPLNVAKKTTPLQPSPAPASSGTGPDTSQFKIVR